LRPYNYNNYVDMIRHYYELAAWVNDRLPVSRNSASTGASDTLGS
jgi:hypothetical protein